MEIHTISKNEIEHQLEEKAKKQGWWPFYRAMKFYEKHYEDFPSDKAYMDALQAAAQKFGGTKAEDYSTTQAYLDDIVKAGLVFMTKQN